MSRITMKDVAVMSVQYVQYTFDYYLDSIQKCGIHAVSTMWICGAAHHIIVGWTTFPPEKPAKRSGKCVGKWKTGVCRS